jgi:hypothetical protein
MKKRLISILLALTLCLVVLPASAETSANALLKSIDKLGQKGWVLNASYATGKDTIGVAMDELGEADSRDYVASAKGTYYTYNKARLVIGANKGDQIFEIRSYDARLAKIKLTDVTGYFGEPDHLTRSKTELFISYKLTNDLNIKFVFPRKGKNPAVSHYCVLYPAGTVNMMADDHGRKW